MSPRRRLMFAVLAAIAVLSAAGLGVRALLRAEPVRVPAQDALGVVLLVPGYGGGTDGLDRLAAAVRATGRTATVVEMPDGGTGDLTAQADTLDRAATDALRRAPSVDVIGYSAGGVVARLWVQRHDGVHKARRVVTLGSPHQGARLAAAGAAGLPGACPAACRQLAPGSTLLAQLRSPVPTPPQWLSIWTEQDQTVQPPDSARLAGATDADIQQSCPGRPVSHGELPTDDYVTGLVLDAIGPAPIDAAPPC
ncbi:esterase/lipase family protein [Dactylosporangium matsuzakiense]|uniref:Lipase n=1 Tax=Dactylosporangium matsuzakiense TaxID=53360 RepID=A0A9W6KTI0_9ACTN|nr:lipase [Dactylosporangium matsuzakiense]GLL06409.1 lipase [Dactylosporangium matsuzakiense]